MTTCLVTSANDKRTMRAMPAEATAWLGEATEAAAPPWDPDVERIPAGAVAADRPPLARRPLRLHSWSTSCRCTGLSQGNAGLPKVVVRDPLARRPLRLHQGGSGLCHSILEGSLMYCNPGNKFCALRLHSWAVWCRNVHVDSCWTSLHGL